jgi:hypothetical protein
MMARSHHILEEDALPFFITPAATGGAAKPRQQLFAAANAVRCCRLAPAEL